MKRLSTASHVTPGSPVLLLPFLLTSWASIFGVPRAERLCFLLSVLLKLSGMKKLPSPNYPFQLKTFFRKSFLLHHESHINNCHLIPPPSPPMPQTQPWICKWSAAGPKGWILQFALQNILSPSPQGPLPCHPALALSILLEGRGKFWRQFK